MTQTITYIAVDPFEFAAMRDAAAKYYRNRFDACKTFYEAFMIAQQTKDAGLTELYEEMSSDLEYIPS